MDGGARGGDVMEWNFENASHWWIRDDELLGNYANKYGAVARVKFTEQGCVA